jgi:hypothetical protein
MDDDHMLTLKLRRISLKSPSLVWNHQNIQTRLPTRFLRQPLPPKPLPFHPRPIASTPPLVALALQSLFQKVARRNSQSLETT